MNEIVKSAILGVIQGLTEFLPVSSSGHLELGKSILKLDVGAEESLTMTIVLHAATALSTIVVFRRDILQILRDLLTFVFGRDKYEWNENTLFSAKIVLSMIPAVIVGVALEEQIENFFTGNLLFVGCMLVLTGALLFLADRAKDTDKKVGFGHAALVGIAQAIAILPGISRSGATISTSVLLGIDRMQAARFSFLMVLPLIFGLMAKKMLSGDFLSSLNSADIPQLLVGFAAAFLTGVVACKWMIGFVRNSKLWWFGIYCLIVGAGAIIFELMQSGGAAGI